MRQPPASPDIAQPGRRLAIQKAAVLSAAAVASPWLLSPARAQGADLAPYQAAKINWRQAEGESITVAVIPASYFNNLETLVPQFEALTGIKVRIEKVPPGQIRQKATLDLSAKTGTYATHAADPMYYPLYVANKWVAPLDQFLNDKTLTDPDWFKYDDILKAWREADSVDGKPYGIPYDGEVTVQVYRKDLYEAKGLKPASTLDELVANAKALNDPANRMYGLALRGFAGAGQNMYVYPSLLHGFGGKWFKGKAIDVNSPEAVAALQWYVETLTQYAPPAVRNWNWPDIADAFSQGTLGCYIDAHSSAAVITNPEKSKVVGKIAYARWPKGPKDKCVSSIWNWGFPINAALGDKAKKATWLFISWAASAETQARTSWKFNGPAQRSGINRTSLWRSKEFADAMKGAGDNFINAALESLEQDTDVEWRPRVPQWPAIGETMATGIQAALVGQKKPKEALDEAQARIAEIMKG
ncbi:sugar ABC transporter substrate-binding protein [Variovorax dokdonensis]|uniref:Sugar ABC transporter substrate-binding protein n=1 Tax=Variovorax dokdonensis TaxID=344883 RepID=A0ABT7N8X9_9BURK|nr:sugar ABC transporter substrate-binding protein [Variovorax dokdonensis]MDM0044392.1 sugar ABC transporter substrate-binding protein [Variovorax dokdonensis]